MFRRPPFPSSSTPIRPCRASLCPSRRRLAAGRSRSRASPSAETARPGQERVEQTLGDIDGAVRTAVTVEPRDGRLCVFMPPTEKLEDYLELVAAAEAAAEKLGLPVQIEGYAPPVDPRLNVIRVAPDPGVIEVNIHPASSWRECVATTEAVYEEARQSRLGADKFMIDGKHAGTGGGNHVVVGGATPLDSPFLRRPDLLKSLVIYWLRRPSLSYFFSGLFIGPTSQAPRIDEARHDSLYELEIALAQIPKPGEGQAPRPWLLDRLMRNILTDVTGNTHRAEICIDKLYSPDGPTGRLGLVEFRGFEMPPDPRMSLAQQLLIRALIARLWSDPIDGPLPRWGSSLHDRFMLPHYVWQDFLDVLADLRTARLRLPLRLVRGAGRVPLPVLRRGRVRGRQARTAPGARALARARRDRRDRRHGALHRQLDRAAAGQAHDRRSGPLRRRLQPAPRAAAPDGDRGRRGRRRALQGVEAGDGDASAPCRSMRRSSFDIFDTWSGRAIGGCVYHVAHPGGRNYDTFPVNSNEAEARRLSRFEARGHTPGALRAAARDAASRVPADPRPAAAGGDVRFERNNAAADATGVSASSRQRAPYQPPPARSGGIEWFKV